MLARVTMEEKYATLSVEYNSLEEKENIFKCNEDAIKKFELSPDVYIKPTEPGIGRIIIEFRNNNREIGKYFESLISCSKIEIKD